MKVKITMIHCPKKYIKYFKRQTGVKPDIQTEAQMFNSISFLKEGMDLSHAASHIYAIARDVALCNHSAEYEIIQRINELKSGELTFGEFQSAAELADYLLSGK